MRNPKTGIQNKQPLTVSALQQPGLFRKRLEVLYSRYNRPEYVHPDPLEFVRRFTDPGDQEVAGLIASSLAYGNVRAILASLAKVGNLLPEPASMLGEATRATLRDLFGDFRHRWTTGEELADLLLGVRLLRERWGSLENCFALGVEPAHGDVLPALARFVAELRSASGRRQSSLLACPTGKSACKRALLYLRWMIRKDDVDPGPWTGVDRSLLVVPMDTHMHRIARSLGITDRRQADLRTAVQVTGFFRQVRPDDPVRYDFALTRFGIKPELKGSEVSEYLTPPAAESAKM